MSEEVARLRGALGWESLKRIGRDYREAYVASRFAQIRGANAVRLLRPSDTSPTPDFAVIVESKEYWFETTEVDRPDRRRGAEQPVQGVRQLEENEWITADQYFWEIERRVKSKAARTYLKCDGLIVWSNAFAISDDEAMDTEWWQRATISASDRFSQCWVWHRDNWYGIF